MGLFSNSSHEQAKSQILSEVAIVNKKVRELASIMDANGVNINNHETLLTIAEDVLNRKMKIVSLAESFSGLQVKDFSVPWIDGRYLSLGMWDLSFCNCIQMVANDLDKFREDYIRNM